MLAAQHVWNIIAAVVWYVFLFSRVQHVNDKNYKGVGGTFVIAGAFSAALALALYEMHPQGLGSVFTSEWTYHIFVVGMVEEGAKFLAFLFAVRAAGAIKEPQDGVIHGAIVGLVFGAIENAIYINNFGTLFMFVRPIVSTGGHAMYCAIWGGLYSQAVYANSVGNDPGVKRNAAIGVPLSALIHGAHNSLAGFYPAALLVKVVGLLIAVGLYRSLVEMSPYRIYPLSMATEAVRSIRRGLVFNPKSPLLNRNMGLYLLRLGKYKAASNHLRLSVPRSKDPRRAQFLAACAEQTFLPNVYAKRSLRIAWSRLTDSQRTKYMEQLHELVSDRDGLYERVKAFSQSAFALRQFRNTRDIARDHKIRRLNRKYGRVGAAATAAIELLTPEDRLRMARRLDRRRGRSET